MLIYWGHICSLSSEFLLHVLVKSKDLCSKCFKLDNVTFTQLHVHSALIYVYVLICWPKFGITVCSVGLHRVYQKCL